MAKVKRPEFSKLEEYVVARDELRFGGKTYKQGDEFPWKDIACSVRKLNQLYDLRKIDMKNAPKITTATKKPKKAKVVEVEEQEAVVDETPDEVKKEATTKKSTRKKRSLKVKKTKKE